MGDRGRGFHGGRGRSQPAYQQQQVRRPEEPAPGHQYNRPASLEPWGTGRAGAAAAAPGARQQTGEARSAGPGPAASGDAGHGRGASRNREQRVEPVMRQPGFDKRGREGRPLDVISNYFQLVKKPDMHLLQYRIDFIPEIDHPGVRKAMLRVHEQLLGKYVFDGTLLYNTTRLAQPLELTSRRNSDESDVRITFRLVGEIMKEDPVYNAVMNIILRRCLGMLNLVLVNRNYFDPAAAERVDGLPITIWPGYLTTIRKHEEEYLLGVEIIHKFLRMDTAYNVMEKIRRDSPYDLEPRIRAELVGKIVMTGYNNKTYRIDDIDFSMKASDTFHLRKENRDVSYIEYYRTRYNQNITVPTQPLLVSRPSRRDLNRGDDQPIYLVPELCGMTGLADEHRNNFNTMRQLGQITRVGPDKRVETLMKFRRRIAENADIQRELNSWGLQFANNLIQCKARILETRNIVTAGNRTTPVRNGDWSRDLHNAQMPVTVKLEKWLVVCPNEMSQQVRNFVQMIKQVGRAQNFIVDEPRYLQLQNDRTRNYAEALRDELSSGSYQFVMCALRQNRTDTYNVIKKHTLCEVGIASQVITERILRNERGLMSVATKVMTQIACKLGAEPWRVAIPAMAFMVIGYDTYHDARQRRAVGAFVASTNSTFSKYYSSVKIHPANEEISPSFRDHMLCSLRAYAKANQAKLPEKIIVYRDGVGAGDIERVLEIELNAIRSAISEAKVKVNKPDYDPGISYIIVSKRINTRLFTGTATGRDQPNNPTCGTVVDNTVTLSNRFDFFLVSQKVNQGTVSPTSYNVIHNSSNISPDLHQKLAYALTQLYFNWAGTLSVPAPVQYAHKLAYLVGENIQQSPLENLSTVPYYL